MFNWEVPVFDWEAPVFDWEAPVFDCEAPVFDLRHVQPAVVPEVWRAAALCAATAFKYISTIE